jgi:hypothetical protein
MEAISEREKLQAEVERLSGMDTVTPRTPEQQKVFMRKLAMHSMRGRMNFIPRNMPRDVREAFEPLHRELKLYIVRALGYHWYRRCEKHDLDLYSVDGVITQPNIPGTLEYDEKQGKFRESHITAKVRKLYPNYVPSIKTINREIMSYVECFGLSPIAQLTIANERQSRKYEGTAVSAYEDMERARKAYLEDDTEALHAILAKHADTPLAKILEDKSALFFTKSGYLAQKTEHIRKTAIAPKEKTLTSLSDRIGELERALQINKTQERVIHNYQSASGTLVQSITEQTRALNAQEIGTIKRKLKALRTLRDRRLTEYRVETVSAFQRLELLTRHFVKAARMDWAKSNAAQKELYAKSDAHKARAKARFYVPPKPKPIREEEFEGHYDESQREEIDLYAMLFGKNFSNAT